MSILGSILGTIADVALTPVAIVADCIPGAGGWVDGNQSHTEAKAADVLDDLRKVKDQLEDL